MKYVTAAVLLTFAAQSFADCEQNSACHSDPSLDQYKNSTVALQIQNLTCTGTLVNNSAADGRLFIITAKHCHADADPRTAAQNMRVAWDAVSGCGEPLKGAFSGDYPITQGAVHRAEDGDTWLVELTQEPPASVTKWYAGYNSCDLTPNSVTSFHNGSSRTQQFISGQAPYKRTFQNLEVWKFMPNIGGASPGSSGASLLDPQGNVIGTLSTSANASCGEVQYARLHQVWPVLKPWLDPMAASDILDGGTSPRQLPRSSMQCQTQPIDASAAGSVSLMLVMLGLAAGATRLSASWWLRRGSNSGIE